MICRNCDYAGRPTYDFPCSRCDMTLGSPFCMYEHEEVPTNADKIRAMNDEELSEFLWQFDIEEVAREDNYWLTRRKLCEWLKQPAEV